ncbi:MAG: glycerophosphodiester phosphodiesterase family protein [Candidatus Bathyarchaeota archaeon]|nr:glycerophosphodiester phosphodiesterase family protein [Candidatus Bathyarchaeum sp.]
MVGNLSRTPKKLKKALVVVFRRDPSKVKSVLESEGFEVVDQNPDFIVCYGGDGTVLFSEREFPEVPKLIIKTSRACRMYDYALSDLRELLSKLKDGKYLIHFEMKLETVAKGERLVGLNEIQVHLKLPIYAVRFSLSVDGKQYNELIGDGVIVATSFGSTAYYKATGGKSFEKGLGISFNNLHNNDAKSFVVPEDSVVTLTITRGPAWLLADNNENFVALDAGDKIAIRKSESVANFIYFDSPVESTPSNLGAHSFLKIGHRGARAYEPENTLRSFRKAIELGVDAVELDVRKTKDDQIVVIHNDDVNKTTNGKGAVSELTLEQIKQLFTEKGEPIPTLDEVLDSVGKQVKVLIELKETGLEEQVMDLISKKGLVENVVIISFHEDALRNVRALNADVATGLVYVRHKNPIQAALDLKAQYLLSLYSFTHSATIKKAHENGLKVIVWTINKKEDVAVYRKKGVDGIASDSPDILN